MRLYQGQVGICSRKIVTVGNAIRSKFAMAGVAASLAFLVAACAAPEKTRWTQPGTGAGPKPTDAASCRADANRRAEREFRLDTQSRSDDAFATSGSLQNELARRDAKRYRQRIYEHCLRSLGYEPAARDRFEAR